MNSQDEKLIKNPSEAIQAIKSNYPANGYMMLRESLDMAMGALEKQVPKKPVKVDSPGMRYTDTYRCPSCGGNFTGTGIANYCYHCGQALDWEAQP